MYFILYWETKACNNSIASRSTKTKFKLVSVALKVLFTSSGPCSLMAMHCHSSLPCASVFHQEQVCCLYSQPGTAHLQLPTDCAGFWLASISVAWQWFTPSLTVAWVSYKSHFRSNSVPWEITCDVCSWFLTYGTYSDRGDKPLGLFVRTSPEKFNWGKTCSLWMQVTSCCGLRSHPE